MLLDLIFGIPKAVIGWFFGLVQFQAFSLAFNSAFNTIFGYGVYLMGDTTFLVVTGCILFWSTLHFILAIVKFIIWLCPFIG